MKNRKQRVVVDGIITKNVDINKGVPQETVISPFLMVDDIKPKQAETTPTRAFTTAASNET